MRTFIQGTLLAFGAMGACGGTVEGEGDTGTDAAECGDVDGPDGDVPNVLGNWTSTWGTEAFYDGCSVTGLKQDDMDWLNGAALEINGSVPDNLYVVFDDDEDERFFGLENALGGIVFTGTHEMDGYTLYSSLGGLVHHDQYLDRDVIEGHGALGVDTTADGAIDCWLKGDWVARKSGN